MSAPSWTERNAGRGNVPSKRIKAAWRSIGPAHPGYGSLKSFARWARHMHYLGLTAIAANDWLSNKGCR